MGLRSRKEGKGAADGGCANSETESPPARGVSYDFASGKFGSDGPLGSGRTDEKIAQDFEKSMEAVELAKAAANEAAAAGDHTGALDGYERAAGFLHTQEMMDVDLGNSDELRERAVAARLALLLNMAKSCLTLAEEAAADQDEALRADLLRKAEERCTQALGLAEVDEHGDDRSPKALYRRALAREGLGQLEDAEADLRDCRALTPQEDKQVRTALARVALGAKAARRQRERMWVGHLPKGAVPTTADKMTQHGVRCCRGFRARVQAAGGGVDGALRQPEAVVPLGTALLSAVYCAVKWEAVTASHAISLFGLLAGAVMWAYEENSGRILEKEAGQRPKNLKVMGKDGSTKFEMKLGAPGTGANGSGMSETQIAQFVAAAAEMGKGEEVVGM